MSKNLKLFIERGNNHVVRGDLEARAVFMRRLPRLRGSIRSHQETSRDCLATFQTSKKNGNVAKKTLAEEWAVKPDDEDRARLR